MRNLFNYALFCLSIATFLLLVTTAQPTTIYAIVNRGEGILHVDIDTGTNTSDCGSTTTPCRTIQYAINQVDSGHAATILVAAGTYTYSASDDACTNIPTTGVLCILNKHLIIKGGYDNGNWHTANPTANLTIIDGNDQQRGILVQRTGTSQPDTSLALDGFIIQNGRITGAASGTDDDTYAFGGGLIVDDAVIIIRNTTFRDNLALGGSTTSGGGGNGSGGGVAIRDGFAGSLLENVVFENNEARGGNGPQRGGLGIGGGLFTFRSNVIANNIILRNNIAQAGHGDGDGIFDGERADAQGGGLALQMGSIMDITNLTSENNQAIGGNAPNGSAGGAFGAGVFAELADDITIHGAMIRGNTAQGGNGRNDDNSSSLAIGGGISSSNSNISLNQIIVVNNEALAGNGDIKAGAVGGGGAGLRRSTDDSRITISNSIFANNYIRAGLSGQATGGGGAGLFLQSLDAEITHTTIANNRMEETQAPPLQGIGIYVLRGGSGIESDVQITNSIVSGHVDDDTHHAGLVAAAIHVSPNNQLTLDHVMVSGNDKDTNANGIPNTPGTINGVNNLLTANNINYVSPNAPDYDYHLMSSSPAIDAGKNTTIAIDIDGDDRTGFIPLDLGADEYVSVALAAVPIADGTLSLDWSVSDSLAANVDHYQLVYTIEAGGNEPDQGASPINMGTQTSIQLTGLANNKQYTLHIVAKDGLNQTLETSNIVTATPRNTFIYLPTMLNQ